MPRRAAAGHRRSRQLRKFAAAARIASAVMRGSPEAPDWPLHSGALAGGATATGGIVPVTPEKRSSRDCAVAAPQMAAVRTAARR